MKRICATGLGVVFALLASAAVAEPFTVLGYNLSARLRANYGPTYEGGKHSGPWPGGTLAAIRPGQFDSFAAPDDAGGFGLFEVNHLSVGLAAALREDRGNRDELLGMRNIGLSIEGGAYANWWPTDWVRLHAEVLRGLTAQHGLLVDTGIDLVAHPPEWTVSVGPRFSWADGQFNNTYFGVTPGEAAASPLINAPYSARAGPHFAGVLAAAEYRLRPYWRLTMAASYHHMLGDDANSPLVKQLGRPSQVFGSVGVRFLLGR